MANYATISDVNMLCGQSPFTAASVPSQTQVEQFLTDISTLINASIGNLGYWVPVDVVAAPLSGVLLKRICSAGAAGMALQVRMTAVSPEQANQENVWTTRYEKWMKALCDNKNPFELPDAQRTGLAVVKPLGKLQRDPSASSVDSGLSSDPGDYLTNPPFTMGEIF